MRMANARLQFERCYNPDGVTRQMAALMKVGDRTELLKTIKIPTTVIHGVDDALIPIACGEDTAKSISDSVFVAINGMGHNIPESLVSEFVAVIDKHLARVSKSLAEDVQANEL